MQKPNIKQIKEILFFLKQLGNIRYEKLNENINELKEQNEELKDEVNKLNEKNEELENELQELKEIVDELNN